MANKLESRKVAVLVADGFEQVEFEEPVKALREASATVHVLSLAPGKVKGWQEDKWGDEFNVDHAVADVSASGYDALVLPGGVINPDKLRLDEKAVEFVRDFFRQNKPVGAICHGPQLLINADVVEGRRLTSFPSVQVDLKNAGADWVDEEVVVDKQLVTSRKPADLDAFCDKIVEVFAASAEAI